VPKIGNMNQSADRSITFHCTACSYKFESLQFDVEEAPEQSHPWNYYCDCPVCSSKAGQINWQKASFAALGKQTGPKTDAGKAAVTRNLEGHPTPEEMQRIRFNAVTHGLNAKVARFHPPKPGKYPSCNTCEYLPDQSCRKLPACVKKTEIFMRTHLAFETGNPDLMMDLLADNQANFQALMMDMFLTVIADGVTVTAPKMYYDKEGKCHVFEYEDKDDPGEKIVVKEIQQHPLLKPLIDLMSKNKMSLEDLNLTPKVRDDHEILKGHLAGDVQSEPADAQKYLEQVQQGQSELMDLIKSGMNQVQVKNDE